MDIRGVAINKTKIVFGSPPAFFNNEIGNVFFLKMRRDALTDPPATYDNDGITGNFIYLI